MGICVCGSTIEMPVATVGLTVAPAIVHERSASESLTDPVGQVPYGLGAAKSVVQEHEIRFAGDMRRAPFAVNSGFGKVEEDGLDLGVARCHVGSEIV